MNEPLLTLFLPIAFGVMMWLGVHVILTYVIYTLMVAVGIFDE